MKSEGGSHGYTWASRKPELIRLANSEDYRQALGAAARLMLEAALNRPLEKGVHPYV